jgi:hypothetical protein
MDRIGTFEGSNLGWSKAARRASKGARRPIIPGNRAHLYPHGETLSANCRRQAASATRSPRPRGDVSRPRFPPTPLPL